MTQFSFSTYSDAGAVIAFWAPEVSGNYGSDNTKGHDYADEVLEYMRQHDYPGLLGHVTKAMIAHGKFGGVEVGFCERVSWRAIRTGKVA